MLATEVRYAVLPFSKAEVPHPDLSVGAMCALFDDRIVVEDPKLDGQQQLTPRTGLFLYEAVR